MNNKFNIISLILFFLFINYSFADEKIKRIGMKIPKKDANQLITLLNKTIGFNA